MGYAGNHLATLVTGVFAGILTLLYFVMPESLHFILIIAISISWFLVFICWIAQKSADYMHSSHDHEEKKNLQ